MDKTWASPGDQGSQITGYKTKKRAAVRERIPHVNGLETRNGSAATYQILKAALQHEFVQRKDLAEQICYNHGNIFNNFDYIQLLYVDVDQIP